MNILDILILAILIFFTLFGYYQGFLRSVFNVASFFISWILGILISPLFRKLIFSEKLLSSFEFYIEGAEFIGNNMEMAKGPVSQLSIHQIKGIMSNVNLPSPMPILLEQNLASKIFVKSGILSIGDTITQTVLFFVVNIFCFLFAFFLIRIILSILIQFYDKIYKLPVLRYFDSPIASGFGLVHGFFITFLLCMMIPIVLIFLQQMGADNIINVKITSLIQESTLTSFFYKSNFLLRMIKGF